MSSSAPAEGTIGGVHHSSQSAGAPLTLQVTQTEPTERCSAAHSHESDKRASRKRCDLGIVYPVGHAFGESLRVITMKSFIYPSNTLLELTVLFLFIQHSRMETEGKIFVGTSLCLDVKCNIQA